MTNLKDTFCPICSKKMINFGSSDNMVICKEHGILYAQQGESFVAELLTAAPDYMFETKKFFEEFKGLQSTFVLSPCFPHHKGFKADDCVHIVPAVVGDNPRCRTIDQLYLKRDIYDKHLIAGQGYLATDIRETFYAGVYLKLQDNPLRKIISETYEQYLARTVMLYNVRIQDQTTIVSDLLNLYAQPTLEGMLQNILHCFQIKNPGPLTNEQLLYSHIFAMPNINIGWGPSVAGVKNAIYSYISSCMSDVDTVSILDNKDDDRLQRILNGKSFDEFKDAFYSAQISTAVNNREGKHISFDILNSKFNHEYSGHYNPETVNSLDLHLLYKTYVVLGEIFKKYASEQFRYGIAAKTEYLSRRCRKSYHTYEEVVLEFWKAVKKDFEEESKKRL